MKVKNAVVDGKKVDIYQFEDYRKNVDNFTKDIAVEYDGYILPIRNKTDKRPGILDIGSNLITKFRLPNEDQEKSYSTEHLQIIDLADSKSISEYISKTKQLRNIEEEMLESADSTFAPQISEEDTPQMKAIKMAVTEKHCDITKYSHRFGENFTNNKRIFNGHDITIRKLADISDKLDMEVELVIRDKSKDVPNPMGKEIKVILTGGADEK